MTAYAARPDLFNRILFVEGDDFRARGRDGVLRRPVEALDAPQGN
jgi:hypothetical protein